MAIETAPILLSLGAFLDGAVGAGPLPSPLRSPQVVARRARWGLAWSHMCSRHPSIGALPIVVMAGKASGQPLDLYLPFSFQVGSLEQNRRYHGRGHVGNAHNDGPDMFRPTATLGLVAGFLGNFLAGLEIA